MIGKVIAINISKEKGVQKVPVTSAKFITDFGIEGDAHAGKWHRQISLLGNESVDKLRALGLDYLSAGAFAENITTEGIVLYELPIGTKIRIGSTLHEVTQIGKECHHGCAIKQQAGDCVMPREGIFTKVLEGGMVNKGDIIEVLGIEG